MVRLSLTVPKRHQVYKGGRGRFDTCFPFVTFVPFVVEKSYPVKT